MPLRAGVSRYPEVNTFADLPDVLGKSGEVYLVKTSTGIIFINRKRAGLYLSDGSSWGRLGRIPVVGTSAGFLPSNPPSGKKMVLNIYYDPELEKYTFEREE